MSKKLNQQFACSKMMLPEHRGSLQEHNTQLRRDEKNSRPVLDEQQWERLQQIFESSLAEGRALKVTLINGTGRETFTGIPLSSDPTAGRITFSSGSGRPQAVKAADIVRLEPAEDFL